MTTADPRSLLYRQLTPEAALAVTRDTLARCDDGELFLQFIASESFVFDDGRLKTADYSRDAGFGLRGVSGEMTGFAHANEISEAAIRRAGETLQLLDPAKGQPAPPPRQNNRHLYTDQSPLDLVPFATKVKLLEEINQAARARDPRVAQVSASLSGSWSVVEVVRADGFLATDVRPLVRLNVSIVAEANGRRETGSFGMGGRWLYDDLLKPESWNRAKLNPATAMSTCAMPGVAVRCACVATMRTMATARRTIPVSTGAGRSARSRASSAAPAVVPRRPRARVSRLRADAC